MFNVKTWVSYETRLSDPIPMEEIEKKFYVFDDPKNEEIIRRQMNSSADGFPHSFRGFVQVSYNGQEIFGQTMFSLIDHVWASYENLLKETYEKGYANLCHPEGPIIVISLHTDKKNPSQLELSVFPDSIEYHRNFSLPKQAFMKAMYEGLIDFYKTHASYCENKDVKLDIKKHLENLLQKQLW